MTAGFSLTDQKGRALRTSGARGGPARQHSRYCVKPVVVLAAGHSAPSGAPAEQTTETSTSSSLQATVFSPLTIRKPVMPAGPAPPLMCADHRLGLSCSEDRVHNAPRGILSVCSDVHVKRPISRLFSAATATSRQRIGGLDQQMSPQQKQELTAGLRS